MDEYSLEQLRAILEARSLADAFQSRVLSQGEKLSINRYAKVIANIEAPLGSFKNVLSGVSKAGSINPLPEVSSSAILEEMRNRQKGIYGEDDRVEVVASPDAKRRNLARSVAAIVERDRLIALDDGMISIGGASLADRYAAEDKPLCKREAFREQPSPAIGTAFLVAPTLVVTANHCLNEVTFAHRCLIFDFETDADGVAPTTYREDQIYAVTAFHGGIFTKTAEDWSLMELDRPVTGRDALKLRQAGRPADNAPLYVIGHPSGLPKKIAGNAEIRINTASSHFVANLDTYGGNSGSPVFNALTHEVEGILVRGDTDYVPLGDCYASLICPINGCRGEDCSRVEPVFQKLKEHIS